MGYDVDYNSVDYADSRAICLRARDDLERVQLGLLNCAQRAESCRSEAAWHCAAAGVPAGGYLVGVLGDALRGGYRLAVEATIAATRLAERVDAAIEQYQQAEAAVEKRFMAASRYAIFAEFAAETRRNGGRPPTEQMEKLLRLMMLGPVPNALHPGTDAGQLVTDSAAQLSRGLEGWGAEQTVALTAMQEPETVQIDGTLNSYATLHRLLDGAGAQEHSKFLVARAGEHRYVLVLPGTQDGFRGSNPFDSYGIVDAFGSESRDYAAPIAQALQSSGAGPQDEVIITGYSQGGIHAANLLASPLLRSRFHMAGMLTLGSPIAGIKLPSGARTLSVEDVKDMVPGTDGRSNANPAGRMTVTFDGPRAQIKDTLPQDGIFGAPHSLDNYADHLNELQEEPTPPVRRQLAAFALPAGPVTVRRFTLQRRPKPAPETRPLRAKDKERLDRLAPPH